MFANHRRQARAAQKTAEAACGAARAELARLLEPPLFPADVIRVLPDGRLEAMLAGRRQIVIAAPAVDCALLRPGHEVLLNRDQTAVIAVGEERSRTGVVATVLEVDGDHVVLQGSGDEEIVAACAPALVGVLRAGDRVLFRRESGVVLGRLPAARGQPLAPRAGPPAVGFDDIGGLDHVVREHPRHARPCTCCIPKRAPASYRLPVCRGVTLVGAAGKREDADRRGVAGDPLTSHLGGARFLDVKPGSVRGSFYGESERNIRELFAYARRTPGMVVLFFDEADTFGRRSGGAASPMQSTTECLARSSPR